MTNKIFSVLGFCFQDKLCFLIISNSAFDNKCLAISFSMEGKSKLSRV